jgi:ubiquinone/menaquinone biosynthesis C-methylase UbiE
MIDTSLALYQDIAAEYYDPERHPTCANFREASSLLLDKWLRTAKPDGVFCEVGAGDSLLAELLRGSGISARELIITDSSPAMLSYSKRWSSTGTYLVLSDAIRLPFPDHKLDLLVSSLGDPYNLTEFWDEVCRVLRPSGVALYTTPAYAWAKAFRTKSNGDLKSAQFDLLDGGSVDLPSWIYPVQEQVEIIEKSGLEVVEKSSVSIFEIGSNHLSPKLMIERGSDAEVVEGYLITRTKKKI